jgi:hypothetical protein
LLYGQGRYSVGPLANLLRIHLRLHALLNGLRSRGALDPFARPRGAGEHLEQARRAALELRRLAERGASLPEATARLVRQICNLPPDFNLLLPSAVPSVPQAGG